MSDYDRVLLHRVFAQHGPFDVCGECPQPATDTLIREARLAVRLAQEARP